MFRNDKQEPRVINAFDKIAAPDPEAPRTPTNFYENGLRTLCGRVEPTLKWMQIVKLPEWVTVFLQPISSKVEKSIMPCHCRKLCWQDYYVIVIGLPECVALMDFHISLNQLRGGDRAILRQYTYKDKQCELKICRWEKAKSMSRCKRWRWSRLEWTWRRRIGLNEWSFQAYEFVLSGESELFQMESRVYGRNRDSSPMNLASLRTTFLLKRSIIQSAITCIANVFSGK